MPSVSAMGWQANPFAGQPDMDSLELEQLQLGKLQHLALQVCTGSRPLADILLPYTGGKTLLADTLISLSSLDAASHASQRPVSSKCAQEYTCFQCLGRW